MFSIFCRTECSKMIMTRCLKYLTINKNNRQYSTHTKVTSTARYCLESVKKYDYENFMCTLLLKNDIRACAFAVRSFNVEIARVHEQISEAHTGMMRLKFWDDAINSCFTKDTTQIPRHPVVIELQKAIIKTKLTKRYFKSLITSRQDRLKLNTFTCFEDLENHSEKSVSNVYYLILEGAKIRNVNADHAASHLGKAQGIIQHIRSVPLAKRLDMIAIPQDILVKNKVSQEEILRSVSSERLNECVFEVASRAHQHLVKARSLLKDVPEHGRSILLPAVAVENYLTYLQYASYDVFHPSLQRRAWKWLPKMWIKFIQNKY